MRLGDCWNCEYLYIKDRRTYCLWYKLNRTDMKWGRIVPIYRIKECKKEEKE